jgi:hypothetical protein
MDVRIRDRNPQCFRVLLSAVVVLAAACTSHVETAIAQSRWSPEALAVAFVIGVDRLDSLGVRLAVDPHGTRIVGSTHDPAVARSLTDLADSVGARVAELSDVLVCPPVPRPVETFDQGCRFKHGIEVVLGVSTPEETESGLVVWVSKHFFTENLQKQRWNIWGHQRMVLLSQEPDGTWRVTGFGPGVTQT